MLILQKKYDLFILLSVDAKNIKFYNRSYEKRRPKVINFYQPGVCQQKWLRMGFELDWLRMGFNIPRFQSTSLVSVGMGSNPIRSHFCCHTPGW